MMLYHYSTEPRDELLSRRAQGETETGLYGSEPPYDYIDSVSFFFDRIPLDVAKLLHHKHKFWKKGTTLYEHEVELDSLLDMRPYHIVESPEKTKLIFVKQDWSLVEDNPELKERYLKEIDDLERKLYYKGVGLLGLEKGISNLRMGVVGNGYDIRESFIQLYKDSLKYPEMNMLDRYASNIPHLMFFTGLGRIKPSKVNKITLK